MRQHARHLLFFALMLFVGAGSAWGQSEFVERGQTATEILGGFSHNREIGGPTLAVSHSIEGWVDLGLGLGILGRKNLSVKAFSANGDFLFLRQRRGSSPLSLALTLSAEADIAKRTDSYKSRSKSQTFQTVGFTALRSYSIGRGARMIPAVGAVRVFGLSSSTTYYAGFSSLSFAFDGGDHPTVVVGLAAGVLDDVVTVAINMGVLVRHVR